MNINPKYANVILTLANRCIENNIPVKIVTLFDGLQVRFPWSDGDLICHQYSYGANRGCVESCGCPWDEDDVTCLTVDEAIKKISEWYGRISH